jgi:hypothetical protein
MRVDSSTSGAYPPLVKITRPELGNALKRAPEPLPVGQRHLPAVRKRMSGPAMRTFLNVAKRWSLNVEEQRALLGWPAESTFYKYKANEAGTLSYDTLNRISLVLGIYEALHVLYPEAELADRWVRLPNSNALFGGKPALSLMIEGGTDGLYQVRRLLDARRGGWN